MFKKIKELINTRIDERRKKTDGPLVTQYWALEYLIDGYERFPTPEVQKASGTSPTVMYESIYYEMMRKNIDRRQEQRKLLDRMHPHTQQEVVQQVLSRQF